jgi:exonuclease SbcD
MRVLHLADLHIYLSGPRAEECRRIIDWIAGNAWAAGPDAIVIAGDVYERRSTPAERLYLAGFLQALADVAPVYLINGNHDDRDDLRLFQKEYGFLTRAEIFLEPEVWPGPAGLRLAFLPWPELGQVSAKAGAAESIATRRELVRSALIDVLRGFAAGGEVEPGKPSLLVAHLSVTGASMDSGQPVSGGEELALSAEELLESGCAGVALGHIHLRQQMKTADTRPVMYAGAPFRGSFGEAHGTKGGLLWDWNGKAWEVTPWDAPARRMVLLERAWLPAEEAGAHEHVVPLVEEEGVADSDVRVRITFPAEVREAMREAMAGELDALRAVAHGVTVEERPTIISRTRCVEIAAARTTMEKLEAWAQAVGSDVPAGAGEKLSALEKLS